MVSQFSFTFYSTSFTFSLSFMFLLLSLLLKGGYLGLPSFLIQAASCRNCISFMALSVICAKESRLMYLTINLKFSLRSLIGIWNITCLKVNSLSSLDLVLHLNGISVLLVGIENRVIFENTTSYHIFILSANTIGFNFTIYTDSKVFFPPWSFTLI